MIHRLIIYGLPAVLLLICASASPDRCPGADEAFHCRFEEPSDPNYDGWPDGWTRRRGPGFPQYVSIKIDSRPSPAGGRSLRVDLDGGAAAAYSPPLPIGPLFTYVLEGCVKGENLQHDRAWLSLELMDQDRRLLGTFQSRCLGSTAGWETLRLGPVVPPRQAALAVIGLHVEPEAAEEDLHGTVFFGDLRLARLPRITLTAQRAPDAANSAPARPRDRVRHLFESSKIEVRCAASGFGDPSARIVFRLQDVRQEELARNTVQLVTKAATVQTPAPAAERQETPGELCGEAVWQPPIPGPGLYRVRATMTAGNAEAGQCEVSLAVLDPQLVRRTGLSRSGESEFGWCLPRGAHPLTLSELSELLGRAGIRWVKYPLGHDASTKGPSLESLVDFSDQLNSQGIEIVGLLGVGSQRPEAMVRESGTASESPRLAETRALSPAGQSLNPCLDDPKNWYPSLEPVLARLATQVRWWQVGLDQDTTFAGLPGLDGKIAQVKKTLDQIGQGVKVGMPWAWTQPLPAAGKSPPWRFLAFATDEQMTEEQLAERLDATKGAGVQRWVALKALPNGAGPPEVRAERLVKQMVVAKVRGAEAIFCPDPFDQHRGLMNEDGTPGALFLPWRTAATLLGGAKYVGSLELPGGSPNFVFARHSDLVMVLWSQQPAEEKVYLGETVQRIDLWGAKDPCGAGVSSAATNRTGAMSPPRAGGASAPRAISVERLPAFLVGLSEPVVRWHLETTLGRKQLPGVADKPYPNSLRLKNTFGQPVRGRAVLTVPEGWRLSSRTVEFRLAADEGRELPLEITLPSNMITGIQPILIDFEIHADRDYHFSVSRRIDVGPDDVRMEVAMRLNDQGQLEVEQTLLNQSQRAVSFRCSLLVPDRRREASLMMGLQPGRGSRTYRLPNGQELLGKTVWLRAEEMDGPRVLNSRLSVRQQ